jgi:hypothetical protein
MSKLRLKAFYPQKGLTGGRTMQPTELRFFQLHNPFYLLSALCMLAGCYGLVHVMRVGAGGSGTVLLLMGVLQVYELLLVGLAWFLISSRRAERDGRMLLLLELVFLVDAAYINAEYCARDPKGGVLVSFLVLVLAFIKVGVMLTALGIRFRLKAYVFLLAHFGAIVGIPLLSSWMSENSLMSDTFFFFVWWGVGLVPLTQNGMIGELLNRSLPNNWLFPLERNFRIAIIVLPFLSMCWHAASMHWVYGFDFHASYLTPLVLGLGVSLSLVLKGSPELWCRRIRWLTPWLALPFSVQHSDALLFSLPLGALENVVFSPLRVGLLAVAVVYFVSFWPYRWRPFLVASFVSSFLAGAGYSVATIADTLRNLSPRTAVEWCIVSIVAAFVFLTMGASVSLSPKSDPRTQRSMKRRSVPLP